ncbi:MAG TPA: tripartite tricarboxylate transporter TctB family protein [Thermomicrobiales bacterium]|nr:tripartite tricarboxylate transporter TctB family protein [Thermomicrobiales bacterium]
MVIEPDTGPGPSPADDNVDVPTGLARWSEILIPVVLVIAGIIILVQTQDIRVIRSMSQVSPRAIPNLVGGGLIVVGVWYAIDIIRKPHVLTAGEDAEDVDIDAPTDWGVLAIIGIGLAIFALLIRPAGFILASAILFAIASTAMGSRRIIANVLIGLILASAVFLLFDTWLGVRLPAGILEFVLE